MTASSVLSRVVLGNSRFLVAPACLIAAVALFSLLSPSFLTWSNAASVLAQASILALLSVGQMFAIATRGFDLSVGANAALASAVAAIAANAFAPAALLIAPVVGLAAGAFNGVMVGVFQLQPIVATLGTLIGLRALALLVTDNGQVVPLDEAGVVTGLAFDSTLWLPPIAWAAFAIATVAALITNKSTIGRRILMLGSNPDGAHLVGVDAKRTLVWAYAVCGALAGCAGLVMTIRAGAGLPTEGSGMELQSIAAAVIGGTALAGGVARVSAVVIGAAFIQTLLTGLNLLGISPFTAEIVVGAVLIGAGMVEVVLRRSTWLTF